MGDLEKLKFIPISQKMTNNKKQQKSFMKSPIIVLNDEFSSNQSKENKVNNKRRSSDTMISEIIEYQKSMEQNSNNTKQEILNLFDSNKKEEIMRKIKMELMDKKKKIINKRHSISSATVYM